MIDYIYDDVTHLSNSCRYFNDAPGFRPLITAMFCLSRGNLFLLRGFSLLFIVLSLYLIGSIFFKEKKERWLFSLLSFHPLLAFPFIYASQLSTSATFFWAACLAKLSFSNAKLLPLFLLASAGVLFRYESIYFYIITCFAILILQWSRQETASLASLDSVKSVFTRDIGLRVGVSVVSFFIMSFFAKQILVGLPSQTDIFSAYSAGEVDFYPKSSHYFVQVYAVFLYLKSFLFPVGAGFFGPWFHWIEIHGSTSTQWMLAGSMLFILGFSIWGVLSPRIPRYAKGILIGVFLFIGISYGLSIRVRHDWYFLSRAYVGTLFFLLALYLTIPKKFRWALIGYAVVSFTYSIFFHYGSNAGFYQWERAFNKGDHPYLSQFNPEYPKFSVDEKIDYFYGIYKKIKPAGILDSSVTARKYAYGSLKQAFFIAEEVGNKTLMSDIASEISASPIYVSTFMQLMAGEIQSSSEIQGNRKHLFCKTIWMGQHQRRFDAKMPFDIYEFCNVERGQRPAIKGEFKGVN